MNRLSRGWFGLRSKLLLLSAVLLVIPYLGYQYILEMEQYLSRGQEQVVLGTARALATALSERPELFNDGNYSRSRSGTDLYVYPMFAPLVIDDGTLADWGDYQQYEQSYREGSSTPYPQNHYTSFRAGTGDPLNFRLLLGEANRMLYFYVKVEDRHPVLRQRDSLRLDRSDALRISMVDRAGRFQRYVVSPYDNEYLYVFRTGANIADVAVYEHEPRITGRFRLTETGYEYEVRLPLDMVGDKFGIALYDVDDPQSRVLEAMVATSDVDHEADLGSLRRPTPEIDRIVAGMGHTNSRVRVVDQAQRVLLSTGDIESASGLLLAAQEPRSGPWQWLRENLLHSLYYQVLTRPSNQFMEQLYETPVVEGDQVRRALGGREQAGFITLQDGITRLLEAAWPIVVEGQVLGAVVVDQNMNGIRTFRNQALETLFDTMIGILLLTVSALFIFASSLSGRIRALRNQAEKVVDERGRLSDTIIVPSHSADEIGDLSRSFANIVERLGKYTQYLENLGARLSHELRTPVTVVRSSLENLRLCTHEPEAEVYIQRAEEGLSRLSLILTNMSEASRLEQILRESDKEVFRLDQVVQACVAEYRQIYPATAFITDFAPISIEGTPEYIAQMLDKIVANAVDFSPPGKPVRVTCKAEAGMALISVSNEGPSLDPVVRDRMFEAMVSARTNGSNKVPHLGLGLHIARMITDYHGGYIYADNLTGERGVRVVIRLPRRELVA
ncbi:MAG: proteobacterial dedicated sortase system histidine kinase [Pseudomonadales bacterium]|nr:proteobacterial dedicated sortase system histidine kinase [Pseudomonadales bacterium]